MPLFNIVVVLAVVLIVLYLVNTYLPIDAKIKQIVTVLVVVVVILWLLSLLTPLNFRTR